MTTNSANEQQNTTQPQPVFGPEQPKPRRKKLYLKIFAAAVIVVSLAAALWYVVFELLPSDEQTAEPVMTFQEEREDIFREIEGDTAQIEQSLDGVDENSEEYTRKYVRLINLYVAQGFCDRAIESAEEYRRVGGAIASINIASIEAVANCYAARADYQQAREYYRSAVEVLRSRIGQPDTNTDVINQEITRINQLERTLP